MPPSPRRPATSQPRPSSPSVSVVMPLRDHGGLALALRGLPAVHELIVVADGSDDAMTALRAARPDALVIRPGRTGAGNALASGVAASTGDVVVTLNGDGSTDPAEIPRFVTALTGGADIALGSRYRDGGGDLTGGRLRRWADLLLIWLVNALFGTRRTDPGFGYAAFWREALDSLDLPDPSPRREAAWGDGPEIGPLLAVRPEARGLRVTEVACVAYPRLRRADRSERPGLRAWLRVVSREYAQQSGRHTADAADGEALLAALRPHRHELAVTPAAAAALAAATWVDADRHKGEPIFGPAARRPSPVARDRWRDGVNPVPHLSARTSDNTRPPAWQAGHPAPPALGDGQPRSADHRHPAPATIEHLPPQAAREIGGHRRQLEGFRQRPELRLINGEGSGTRRGRGGRLRPVPRTDLT
jgi:Glycosyl transferase family 2